MYLLNSVKLEFGLFECLKYALDIEPDKKGKYKKLAAFDWPRWWHFNKVLSLYIYFLGFRFRVYG
jgi:hypothetical protein